MTIAVGDMLPDAPVLQVGADPAATSLKALAAGKTVAIFGVPGAFTPTCSTAHLPGFVTAEADLRARGVDEILCLSVNDGFVMDAWAEATGAKASGIIFIADAEAQATRAMGLAFSAPPVGLIDRCQRFVLLAKDGKVSYVAIEDNPGVCDRSGAEALLAAI